MIRFFLLISHFIVILPSFYIFSITGGSEDNSILSNNLKEIDPFSLIDQETKLIDLLYQSDPLLIDLKDPLEIAKRLLPIVAKLVVHKSEFQMHTIHNHNRLSSEEYYEKVIRHYDGIQCGGINTFFARILREYFEVKSIIINMGTLHSPETHLAVIVPLETLEGVLFYLFDAYYTCYFTDEAGKPMDIASILRDQPFFLTYLDLEIKMILKAERQDFTFLKKVNIDDNVYSFSSLLLGKEFPNQNCSWRKTSVLRYLDIGTVLGIGTTSYEMKTLLLELLNNFQIGIDENIK